MYYHAMSLSVTLGYHVMVCSQDFLQTGDEQETRTQCSKEFEPYHSELN